MVQEETVRALARGTRTWRDKDMIDAGSEKD
jgi:hypothetical protein